MKKYLKKYWIFCILAPLFMVGEVAMDLLQPSMMAKIVDQGVMKNEISLIIGTGSKMILAVFLGGACGIICNIFANIAAQGVGNDLRKDVFQKIMNLSFQETERFSTGSLITRLSSDINQIQNMVMMSIRGFVRNTIMLAGGIFMLYRQSEKFAFVAALGLPFIVGLIIFFLKKASPRFVMVQQKLDSIHHTLQETVLGARVVKAYAREEAQMERFEGANEDYFNVNLSVQSLLAFLSPCMNIVLNICIVGVILVSGYSMKEGADITPGSTMAAITYLSQILHGIIFMANIFQTFSKGKASVERIQEILCVQNIITDGKYDENKGKTANTVNTEERVQIEFRDVFFSYPQSQENDVLKEISFQVKRGETFGIIGPTGSGKSTLVHLIPRFYDVTKGEILIDGRNIKEYSLATLRNKISIVLQKAELYSRTIEENIRWSKTKAEFWEIKKAAAAAQADHFIEESIHGFQTLVTERGHSLSGGQKQRISIARNLLKDHDILILDDATSALDLKTEAALYKELENAYPGKTKIIIAQRIVSVMQADRIAVLEGGKITAIGTHHDLIRESSIYREIYESQQREGELLNEG